MTSMAHEALLTTPLPQLPNELCRDIIENLHPFKDRNTLLHFALVNRAWCAESQRVLFRTVCDDPTDWDECEDLIYTHTLFLKAITLNPARLGPYVQTYKQRELICHPFFAAHSESPSAGARSYLWDLTAQALPALINLKHLFIVPLFDDSLTPRASLLYGCTFKLESLTWGFESYNPSSTDPFVEFLRTQHDLVHLEVGSEPSMQDLSWLPDNLCPSLMSTACLLESAGRVVAKRRNLAGLKIWNDWHSMPQSHLSTLHRLKFLSMPTNGNFMSRWHWGTMNSHIALLELTSWNGRSLPNLSGLSNLRVLVLLRVPPEDPSRFYGLMLTNVKEEFNLKMRLATGSFHQCPNLKHVVIEDIRRGDTPRQYSKLTLTEYRAGINTVLDIQSEGFPMENEFGKPWWTAYDVQ